MSTDQIRNALSLLEAYTEERGVRQRRVVLVPAWAYRAALLWLREALHGRPERLSEPSFKEFS